MDLVLVDPSRQVPAYDRALAGALAELGDTVTLATAPLLYYDAGPPPQGVEIAFAFGRLLGAPADAASPANHRLLIHHAAPRRLLRAAGYPWELAAFLRWIGQARPAVVHVQWSLAPSLDGWALKALRRMGIATVLTAHNVVPHEPRPWHAALVRRLYQAPDRLIVHSAAARTRLVGLGGIDPARVRLIPMPALAAGPSVPHAPESMLTRDAARVVLDLPTAAPLALFFGQIRPYKGLDLLLAAWRHGVARSPESQAQTAEPCLVVAGPVAGGRPVARRIRDEIDRLGIAASVTFRPGYVPEHEVAAYFTAADLVVLPYRAVDDSAVLASARGYGRAVVATAVGGLPEALAAGGGRLVPPADPAALAVALADLLAHPELRARLEAEARAAAAAWTWPDAAIATRAIYAEAVAEVSRPDHR